MLTIIKSPSPFRTNEDGTINNIISFLIPYHIINHIHPVQQSMKNRPTDGLPLRIRQHNRQCHTYRRTDIDSLLSSLLDYHLGFLVHCISVNQFLHRDFERFCHGRQGLHIRLGLSLLSIGHRLSRNMKAFRQLLLGHPLFRPNLLDGLSDITHGYSSSFCFLQFLSYCFHGKKSRNGMLHFAT